MSIAAKMSWGKKLAAFGAARVFVAVAAARRLMMRR